MKPGLFKITLMKFGEKDNYLYGLKKKNIPYFNRIKQYFIIFFITYQ